MAFMNRFLLLAQGEMFWLS